MQNPKYGRILLKLSGEILAGDKGFGIDPKKASYLANEVKSIFDPVSYTHLTLPTKRIV